MPKRPLILALRGHIRNSFTNNKLRDFVLLLKDKYNLSVYINTWDIIQNNLSWRQIEQNNTKVTEDLILEYFDFDKTIKNIHICTDESIVINGRTDGTIGTGRTPIRGWKNMWFGKQKLANTIFENEKPNTPVLNMRFDIFSLNTQIYVFFYYDIDKLNIFIEQNYDSCSTRNVFLMNMETEGIDNIYLGTPHTVLTLANYFHQNLDGVLEKYPSVYSGEFLVYRENLNLY